MNSPKFKNHCLIVLYVDFPMMREKQFHFADKKIAMDFCREKDGSIIEIKDGKVINQ
jgi:hypothetical protein